MSDTTDTTGNGDVLDNPPIADDATTTDPTATETDPTASDESQEYVTESGRTISTDDDGNTVVTDPDGSTRRVQGDHYDNAVALAELFRL